MDWSATDNQSSGKVTQLDQDTTGNNAATREEREKLAILSNQYAEEYRKEERRRLKMYKANFTRELMGRYFTGNDIFGEKIYEETRTDGIRESRWTGTESYADPASYLKEKESISKSEGKSSTNKGKQPMKYSS